MSKKPTYEELEQKVKELEKEAIDRKRVEEALRESEVRYRHLVDLSPDGIAIESEGNIVFINKAGVEILGAKNAIQLIGKPVMDFVHSDYHKIVKERIRQLKEEGKKVPLNEEKYIRLDGITIDVEVTVSPIIYQNKLATQIFVRDITERKRAEEALREREAEQKAILDASIDRIRLVDKDLRIIWANKTTTREVNMTTEDLAGHPCYKIFPSRDTPCPGCSTKKALESGQIEHAMMHQTRTRGINGESYWSIYAVPIKNESDDSIQIIQIVRNITEAKRAEELLRESEERLNTILNTIQAGIVVIDAETHEIVDANPAAIKMIGAPKEQIIGHICHKYICPAEKGKCPITDLRQEIDNSERILLTANGKEIPILKTVTPMILRGKEYLLDSFIDITEKKHLEVQFQQAQRMESIGTLAGGIAHNFNNLLMGIEGYVSLMLMDIQPTHPHCKNLEGIEKQVDSGAELTKQLLGFARGGKYEIVATNLNELIKTQNRMFGRTKKEITVRGKYEENLWIVEVDQGQIEQVLLNLYVNAWQAMPKGGDLYIQTENVTLDEDYTKPFSVEPGRYVKISITDTGVGMDKETQMRIFEPFFSTKEMGKGTGLGLSSVYGIIKNHDGIINVDSIKGEARPPRLNPAERDDGGQGTTFTIYLPVSEKEIIKEEKLHEETLKGKETVLLVDDEDTIIDVGEGILKTLGYKALIARGGKEAIEIYKKNKDKIDIVILDMIMPGVGGGEAYDRMKEINPNIKVLLSSGYSINGQATEILERGCDGFIQKPFNMKRLSQRIREILDS